MTSDDYSVDISWTPGSWKRILCAVFRHDLDIAIENREDGLVMVGCNRCGENIGVNSEMPIGSVKANDREIWFEDDE